MRRFFELDNIIYALEDPDVFKIAVAVAAGILLSCLAVLIIGLCLYTIEVFLELLHYCYAWVHHRLVRAYRSYRFSKSDFPTVLAAKFKEALEQYGPDAEIEFRIYNDHYTITYDGQVDTVPYYSLGFSSMRYRMDIKLCRDAVLPHLGPGFSVGCIYEAISHSTLASPVITPMESIRGAYADHALIARTFDQKLRHII